MTGSLSVRGEVLPIGGITAKIEGAYNSGIKEIICPQLNMEDIVLPKDLREKINIHPVTNLSEVLAIVLVGWNQTEQDRKFLTRLKSSSDSSDSVPSSQPSSSHTPTT